MILPQELRIWNFVKEEVLGICPIVGIEKESVWLTDKVITIQSYHIHQSNIAPIELSPEILEKAGFTHDSGRYWLALEHGVYFAWDFDGGTKTVSLYESSGEGARYGKPIKYLHILQNLFFALTGIELEINF